MIAADNWLPQASEKLDTPCMRFFVYTPANP